MVHNVGYSWNPPVLAIIVLYVVVFGLGWLWASWRARRRARSEAAAMRKAAERWQSEEDGGAA